MKKVIFLFFVLSSMIALSQNAMYEHSITLENGDSTTFIYGTDYVYPIGNIAEDYWKITKSKEEEIANRFFQIISSNSLLNSIENYDEAAIKESVFGTLANVYKLPLPKEGEQGYYYEGQPGIWNFIIPVISSASPTYHRKMNEFLHKAIKIKRIREFGYKVVGDLLVDYCKIFPKDYKDNIINQLNDCIKFINQMDKHNYQAIDAGSGVFEGDRREYKLYVDGKANDKEASGLTGFIIRRIIIDNVPKEEIAENIRLLITKIEAAATNEYDYYSDISFNDNLHFFERQSISGFFINNKQIECIRPNIKYTIVYYSDKTGLPCYIFKYKNTTWYIVDTSGEVVYNRFVDN